MIRSRAVTVSPRGTSAVTTIPCPLPAGRWRNAPSMAPSPWSGPISCLSKYWRLIRSAAGNVAWTEDDTLVQRARRIKSPAEMDVFR